MERRQTVWRPRNGSRTRRKPGPPAPTKPLPWRPEEGPFGTPGNGAAPRAQLPAGRSRNRAIRLAILATLAFLVADLIYSTVGIAHALNYAADRFEATRRALAAGEIDAAEAELADALAAAGRARALTGHPGFALVSALPDARGLSALVDASDAAARAGSSAVAAAAILHPTNGAGLYADGRVNFDAIDRARPLVAEARRLIANAGAKLTVQTTPALSPLRGALAEARTQVAAAARVGERSALFLDALPDLMGRGPARRYLLAFQALGEARATGGLIGFYGVLEADDGRMRLVRFGPVGDVFPRDIEAVTAPRWFRLSYGPQSALSQVQQVNVSPNFPVVSEALLEMYESVTGESLDGVVAMDPVALSQMLRSMGPLDVGRPYGNVTATDVVDIVMRDSYLRFEDPAAQERFLGDLVAAFWDGVQSEAVDTHSLGAGLGEAFRTQHVKLYSRDEEAQETIKDLGAGGYQASAGPNVQMVFHNNYAPNKVDYYLERDIDTRVELESDGRARVVTTIDMSNHAPDGPPSSLLGPYRPLGRSHPPGLNRMLLNVLIPEGAELVGYEREGKILEPLVFREDAASVVWDVVEILPGGKAQVRVEYEVDDAVALDSTGGRFAMTLWPQTMVVPDTYSVTVMSPAGYEIRTSESEASVGNSFHAEGSLDQTRIVRVDLVPE